jgi:NADPH2:quinone reductase
MHTGGHGADIAFDAVGGVMFETALGCLARIGRLIEIAATGRRRVEFDLLDFYRNESRILGADSRTLHLVASSAILDRRAPLFGDGMIEAPLVNRALPLACGNEAYQMVAAGAQGASSSSHEQSPTRRCGAPCASSGATAGPSIIVS